ncbi:MAG: hypothetical protein ACRCYS_11540 [Beijerinckiaceae bacterium]
MSSQSNENSPKGRICPECGESFTTKHPTKRFCNQAHKQAYANREASQGKVIASLVKAWRLKRGNGDVAKNAFAELCRIVDRFNADDRQEGRPPATVYVEAHFRSGYLYIDRKRG